MDALAFPVATFIGMVLGLCVPQFGDLTAPFIVWLLIPLMVFSLVKVKPDELRDGLRRPDLLGWGLAFLYIIVPLVLWGTGLAAGVRPEYLFGVTLAALAPSIALAPFFADMIGGNRVSATLLSVVSTLLSPVLIPFILVLLVGRTVNVPVMTIMLNASLLVGLPVLIAVALRKAKPALRDNPVPGERYITAVVFLFFIWGVIASSLGDLDLFEPSVAALVGIAILQEYFFFFGLRFITGKLAGRGYVSLANAKSFSLCVGVKNGAMTAGIALTFSPVVAISSGMITLVSAPLFILFGIFRDRM